MAKEKSVLSIEEKVQKALVSESEQPYKVPSNWCWTRLGEVSEIVTGGTPSKENKSYYGGNFPFIKPADLDQGRKTISASECLSDSGKEVSRIVRKGSTSVCCIGTIGKSGFLEVEATTNQQINTIIPHIEDLFMYYYSCTIFFVQELINKASATTISIVNKSKMAETPFPLPPLAEQKRIVERIESMFSKLDEAKSIVLSALDTFENRKAAILHKAFTGELTANWRKEHGIRLEDWAKVSLNDIGTLERGKSKHRPRNDQRLFGGEYPFVQTGDIARAETYVLEHKQTLSEFGVAQSKVFPKDTLCITIAANIGDVAILSYDCCFPDSVVAFTTNDKSLSKFVFYKMLTLKKDIEANAPATAQKNINLKILSEILFTIPSLPEQKEIVRILDSIFEKEEKAKELCSVVEPINIMKKAILAKAFRGELGTNRPDEESSVELLRDLVELS